MLIALVVGLCAVGPVGMAWDESRARKLQQAIRDAICRSGLTMLRAAQEAQRDQGQITRQVACDEGFGRILASIDSHPREAMFLRHLSVELAVKFGLPREVRVGQRLRQARVARRFVKRGRAA